MKKFLILSAVVGLAGLGVGLAARQSDPTPPITVAAAVPETATTAPATNAPTSSTTVAPKVAAKPTAAKVTTTTTRQAVPSTSTTMATTPPAAPSTTTTTVAAPQVTPTCSISAAPAAAGSYVGGGTWEDVRISSNMPKTRTRLTVQYPSLKQSFWLTTDAGGAAKKIFELRDSGTTSLSVDFYDTAENHVGGSPACQATFMAAES